MNPAWQKSPGRAECCFVVATLFFFMGGLFRVFTGGDISALERRAGNIGIQAIFMVIYIVTFALILPRLELFLGLWRQNRALLLLVGLAAISLFWSAEPGLTFRRLGALLGTMSFGAYLVMRFPPEQLLRLLAWGLGIMAVFSLMFVVALPEFGVHAEPNLFGAWRGVFDSKIKLGFSSALGILVFLLLALEIKSYRWLAWIFLGLCGLLLAMSGSRVSWLTTGLLIIVLAWLWLVLKTHYSIAIPIVAIGTVAFFGGIAWVMAHLETATALIGRDATLTGRTWLWTIFVEDMERPWFGYGYRSYLYSKAYAMVKFRYAISVTHAHNGYLSLWLELGFAGIAAFLLTIWVGLRRMFAQLRRARGASPAWLPALFIYCVISTIPVPVILAQNHIIWVLFVATLFYWTGRPPEAIEAMRGKFRHRPALADCGRSVARPQ